MAAQLPGLTAEPKLAVFGRLKIENRVLETPDRTIAIDNIATITFGTVPDQRSMIALLAAIGCALGAIMAGPTTPSFRGSEANPAFFFLIVTALVLAAIYFRPDKTEHFLTISTSDGTRSPFHGPQSRSSE